MVNVAVVPQVTDFSGDVLQVFKPDPHLEVVFLEAGGTFCKILLFLLARIKSFGFSVETASSHTITHQM